MVLLFFPFSGTAKVVNKTRIIRKEDKKHGNSHILSCRFRNKKVNRHQKHLKIAKNHGLACLNPVHCGLPTTFAAWHFSMIWAKVSVRI